MLGRGLAGGLGPLALAATAAMVFGPLVGLRGAWSAPDAGVVVERLQSPLGLRTLMVAAIAAATTAALGTAIGIALSSGSGAAREATRGLALVPLLLPPYVLATAWLRIAGNPGDATASLVGAGLVLGAATGPLVALPVAGALARRGGAQIDAARLLLGRRGRFALAARIAGPPIAAGALLAFGVASINLAVPMVLRADVYALEILARMSLFDLRGALDAAAVPVAPSLAALALAAACAPRAVPVLGGERPAAPARFGAAAAAGLVLAAALAVAPAWALSRRLRVADMRRALATAGDELFTSLGVAGAAAAIATALAFAAAPFLGRIGRAGATVALAAFAATCALPGACVGIGLQHLAVELPVIARLAATPAILVAVAVARFAPIALLLAWVAASARPRAAHEAARLAGLGPIGAYRAIELPRLGGEILAVFAVVFALAAGELEASTLVAPPGAATLSIRLAALLHFGEDAMVDALCLVLAFLVLACLAATSLIAGRVPAAPIVATGARA